jgi:hypothetical protein
MATQEGLSLPGLYISGPETSKKVYGKCLVTNVPEGQVLYLAGEAGLLQVKDYETEYREVHEKWNLKCRVLGTLYVDRSKVKVFEVEGVDVDPTVQVL